MSATSIDPQKENIHDNDFEPYLTGQSTQNNSYQSMSDPYLSSYYAPSIGFPYPLSEAPWSTGGDPPIPYLTPYGPLSNGDHHFMPDTVFSQPGGLGSSIYPHRFNFFPENQAFSAWGTGGSQGQQTQSSAYGGSYNYPPSSLGGTLVPDGQTGFHSDTLNKAPGMNSLDQGMVGLKIGGGELIGQGSAVKAVGSLIGGPALAPAGNGAMPMGMPPVKPASWAAIASKPAKPPQLKLKAGMASAGGALPPPIKHNMNIGTWDKGPPNMQQAPMQPPPSHSLGAEHHPVLEKLCAAHSYNPKEFEWNLKNGRVFIIKSYSEDDIHRSIKYSIWCSTEHGNKRLDGAFRNMGAKGPVYLLFSVNGSGHFCGVAEMRSPVDYGTSAGVWAQDKWKGKFDVDWLFVKDVPNGQLRHIRLENNDNKPVTNSRDTQEVPLEKAKQTFEPAPVPSRPRLDQERQNRNPQ
ncbi:hypothetical protein NHX12_013047 [Muraenolepis orangiensis]|uniref:YTH domain-containing family protein n=1 Tax=Muraenolepis orangiensis TaxID=630683 RepID=A0A9Q0DFE8_9TELE|nr:hypothetical protein NHX12_013047 [Muraenolepis orangiensis]